MLDIKYIRENIELVKENLKKKFQEHKSSSIDELLLLDEKLRDNIKTVNALKQRRNQITDEISIKKAKKEGIDDLLKEAKELPGKIDVLDKEQNELRAKVLEIQKTIPNIISDKTPIGKDQTENVEIRRTGEIPKFDYQLKSHGELAESLNIIDLDAARDNSGKGFYYLKGDLALLSNALMRYSQDFLAKKGYTFVLPPLMINKRATDGAVDMSFFKEMIYKIEDEDLYMIATSEHPVISLFVDRVIDEEKLPIKMYSYSTCFRKEIGSHGLDERGLFRLHQFDKVEQVVLCKPEDSEKIYDEILENSFEIFKSLGLPTRVLEICTGDLGDLKFRSADVEAWSPRKGEYIEVGSCSNLTGAQATRLNIKAKTKSGEKYFVHTLNNTAIANSRALVAILENYQTKEGTVRIPEVLVPYMYGKTEIKKNLLF
ncbi:MAG: serine--tRNA ligase [archaeon]